MNHNYLLLLNKIMKQQPIKRSFYNQSASNIDSSPEHCRALVKEASNRKTSHARAMEIRKELSLIRQIRRKEANQYATISTW